MENSRTESPSIASPPALPTLAYHGHGPLPSRRPRGVTALAVIGIVWASLELLVAAGTLATRLAALPTGPHAAVVPSVNNSRSATYVGYHTPVVSPRTRLRAFMATLYGAARWILAALLLVSAIAALRLRPWGRQGMIAWAWIAVALFVIQLVQSVTFDWSILHRQILRSEHEMQGALGPSAGHAVALAYWATAIIFMLAFQLYPIWILATFGKPRIKSAFSVS